ncbi:hypothetical protein FCV25MIE_14782 [Fagus crenata]
MQDVEEVARIHGQKTYVGVVGRGVQATFEKEKAPKMVVVPPQPSLETSQGFVSGNKFAIQNTPQNQAHSKICLPLQFFPNQNISSDNRKLGTGLIICLNKGEKRCVSRRLKEEDQSTRATWVPRVNHQPNGPGQAISTQVGSTYQPIFEKGESSGLSWVGPVYMDPRPKDLSSRPAELNELNHAKVGTTLTLEHSGSNKEIVGGAGDITRDPNWSVQLKDGRHLVLPDFLPSPWIKPTNLAPSLAPCLTVANVTESMETPFFGTPEDDSEVVEGVVDGSSIELVGLEVVSLPDSDTLIIQPMSMLSPLLADFTTSSEEKPSIKFYQNPPLDWVLGHMKAFGSLVGASYEGYEDKVIALLQKIESRRPQSSDRTPKQD